MKIAVLSPAAGTLFGDISTYRSLPWNLWTWQSQQHKQHIFIALWFAWEVFHLGGQWHPWHWVKWPMATLIADPCVVALPGGGTPFELLTFTGRTGSIFPKIPIDMCLPNAVCETCLHMPELGWQRPSAPNLVVWLPHYDNLNDNRVPECPTGTSSETGDFKGTSAPRLWVLPHNGVVQRIDPAEFMTMLHLASCQHINIRGGFLFSDKPILSLKKKHSKERTVGQEVAVSTASSRSPVARLRSTDTRRRGFLSVSWITGWWFGTWILWLSIYFQRGRSTTNQIIAWCITPSLQRLGPWQGICQWANAESHKAVIRIHRGGWKTYLSMDWFKGKFTGNHRFSY